MSSRSPRRLLLLCATVILAVAAARTASVGLERLLYDLDVNSAFDLKLRHAEVQRWFSGQPVYAELRDAIYPPATYAMLWPFLGWSDLEGARRVWAGVGLVSLLALSFLLARGSGVRTSLAMAFVALLAPAIHAMGDAIGNGQIVLQVLTCIVASFACLGAARGRRGMRLCAGLLFALALAKPNVTLPFVAVMLAMAGGLETMLAAGGLYLAATLAACAFQAEGPVTLVAQWLHNATIVGGMQGNSNVGIWLVFLGWGRLGLPVAFVILALHAAWVFRHRDADPWLLLGVTGIVARIWTYHNWYDDVLILLPLVALVRRARLEAPGDRASLTAVGLLAVNVAGLLPGFFLRGIPGILWFPTLAFLLALPEGGDPAGAREPA